MGSFKGNKYLLVNVAAQRARQINEGGVQVYVRERSKHPLDVALEEIRQGFIDFDLGVPEETDKSPSYEDLITFEEMIGMEDGFDLEDFEEDEVLDLEAFDLDDDEDMPDLEDDDVLGLDEEE
jgi:DNA-directed RNA polymerase omega subunit